MEYIYGALLLHKTGQPVSEENLKKVVSATGASVDESKVKVVVASLKDVNIDEQLKNAKAHLVEQATTTAGAESAIAKA